MVGNGAAVIVVIGGMEMEMEVSERKKFHVRNKTSGRCFLCGKPISIGETICGTLGNMQVPLCYDCYRQRRLHSEE